MLKSRLPSSIAIVAALIAAMFSTSAFADWTSYAVDGRGAVGHGRSPDRESAQGYAMDYCGNVNCEVILTRRDRCVALAESFADGYYYGTGAANSKSLAMRYAKNWCGKSAPISTCRVRHAYCQ